MGNDGKLLFSPALSGESGLRRVTHQWTATLDETSAKPTGAPASCRRVADSSMIRRLEAGAPDAAPSFSEVSERVESNDGQVATLSGLEMFRRCQRSVVASRQHWAEWFESSWDSNAKADSSRRAIANPNRCIDK
jgi:hypothetical protein